MSLPPGNRQHRHNLILLLPPSFGTNDGTVQGVASDVVHYRHHSLHNYVHLKRKVLQYSASWWLTQWNNVGFSEALSVTSSHIRPTAPVLEPCLFLQAPKKTFVEVQNRKSEAVRTTETLMTVYQSTRCNFRNTWIFIDSVVGTSNVSVHIS